MENQTTTVTTVSEPVPGQPATPTVQLPVGVPLSTPSLNTPEAVPVQTPITPIPTETPTQPILTPPTPIETKNSPAKRPPYIKTLILILLFIVIALGGFGYYVWHKTMTDAGQLNYAANTPMPSEAPGVQTLTPTYMGNYDVVIKWLNDDCVKSGTCNGTGDIYLKDRESGQETLVTTADNLQLDSRGPQYENGYVFVLKRVGYDPNVADDQDWTEELWVYTQKDQGMKIFDKKGLSFLANSDASLVAVSAPEASGQPAQLSLLSRANNWRVKQLSVFDYAACNPEATKDFALNNSFSGFSKDSQVLWGSVTGASNVNYCIWSMDLNSDTATYYPTEGVHTLFDFNVNNGLALYIDKPFQFDESSDQAWMKANPTYSLSVYSIKDKQSLKIDTFPSSFYFDQVTAQWVSDTEFKYSSPKGDVTFKRAE